MGISERLTRLNSARFASKAVVSLLHNKPGSVLEENRRFYIDMATVKAGDPLNREEDILPRFLEIIEARKLQIQQDSLEPYWSPGTRYNPLEVFGTVVQFLGQHNEPLPSTVLPPEQDVATYVGRILQREGRVTITEQFEELLDITHDDMLGAANLGFIASRFMARGDDARAYPNMYITQQEMLAWNDKVAQFETHDRSGRSDGPGDTYYFWTYMFATVFYNKYMQRGRKIVQHILDQGTPIMRFVKHNLTHVPVVSSHYEASRAGRNVGLALAKAV